MKCIFIKREVLYKVCSWFYGIHPIVFIFRIKFILYEILFPMTQSDDKLKILNWRLIRGLICTQNSENYKRIICDWRSD